MKNKVKITVHDRFTGMEAITQANKASIKLPRAPKWKRIKDPAPIVQERVEVIQVFHRLQKAEEMQ